MKRIAVSLALAISAATANAATTGADGQQLDTEGQKPAGTVQQQPKPENPHYQQKVVTQNPIIVLPPVADDRDMTFGRAMREESMLTPAEIREYREYLRQKEMAVHSHEAPTMRSKSHSVSLAPGSTIPKISIAPRYVGSLVIVDSRGNPWPIVGHTKGAPDMFRTSVPEADPQNVLNIDATRNVGASNLSIHLEGQTVPLIVQLEIDPKIMDIRADLVIDQLGPRSNPMLGNFDQAIDATPDSTMMAFVDGVPPQGAVALGVSDNRFRAWEYGGDMFIRTGVHISSPRYHGISHGTGGVKVYRMASTPMVLFNANGKVGTLRISLKNLRTDTGVN